MQLPHRTLVRIGQSDRTDSALERKIVVEDDPPRAGHPPHGDDFHFRGCESPSEIYLHTVHDVRHRVRLRDRADDRPYPRKGHATGVVFRFGTVTLEPSRKELWRTQGLELLERFHAREP